MLLTALAPIVEEPHAGGAVPLSVTLLFAALLVAMILCLALEEKLHNPLTFEHSSPLLD